MTVRLQDPLTENALALEWIELEAEQREHAKLAVSPELEAVARSIVDTGTMGELRGMDGVVGLIVDDNLDADEWELRV